MTTSITVKKFQGRIKYVNLFSLIAWIILIIACINFMNLSTARSEQRAREVGVRKVLGAGRRKLIAQFIGESLCMSMVSAVLAIVIIYFSLPAFNSLVEKQLSLHITNPFHIAALLVIALVCGLIAGKLSCILSFFFQACICIKGDKSKKQWQCRFYQEGTRSTTVFNFCCTYYLHHTYLPADISCERP